MRLMNFRLVCFFIYFHHFLSCHLQNFMLLPWLNRNRNILAPDKITTGQCPLLSDHPFPKRTVKKAVRLCILMHFHNYNFATYKFPSCRNGRIHQQGYNSPRQRNEATTSHPSGHLNAERECGKGGEIAFYIFVVSKTCPFTLSFVFSHFPIV